MNQKIKHLLLKAHSRVVLLSTMFDKYYIHPDISAPKLIPHSKWWSYLFSIGNHEGKKILEIGSREVTGESAARANFSKASYLGFDYYGGNNVDIVGDAHKLSSYFNKDEKFDIIYSSACFEHFAMPWVVATEIAKLLNVGGIVMIETHFSFIAHERPWNFFQFSDMGLKALFSPALGFETIDSGMSNPMVGRFSSLADSYLKNIPLKGLYCHSEYLGRKVKDVPDFDWSQVSLNEVVQATHYPLPK